MGGRLRLGIIGAGRMGITHYAILNTHPDVKVTALADTTPVVSSLLGKYLDVHLYRDHAQLLAEEALDAAVVCTPPALNHEVLHDVLRAGLHVFVEKPGTLSSSAALELAALFEQRGLINQVGYVNRFNDVFVAARSLLERGILGRVIHFRTEMHSRTILHEEDTTGWRAARRSGGGAVYEMASHAIDLVNYLIGRPDHVVGTCLGRVFSSQVEDLVSSSFIYESGTLGSLYVNWSDASYRKPVNRLEVFGARGKLLADQYAMKVYLEAAAPELRLRAGWNTRFITDLFSSVPFFLRGVEFTAQLHHFVDCIRAGGGTQTRCTLRDAAVTLAVIEEMFRDHAQLAGETV